MYLIVLGFSLLCFLGVGAWFLRSPLFSLFHPFTTYLAFHGLVFVIRPIMVHFAGHDAISRVYQFTPSLSDKITVIAASNLGFLVFALCCLRVGNLPMRFTPTAAIAEERRRLARIFGWVVVLAGPPALYSLSRSFGADNIYTGLTLDRQTGVAINTINNGYVVDLQMMAVTLCALIAWLMRFRLYSLLPLAGFALTRAGTGGRGPFVTAIVATGLFYLYDRRQKVPRLGLLLAAVALLAAFNMVGADRGATIRQVTGLEQGARIEERPEEDQFFLYGMDFANMEFFEYLVYVVPQRSGTYDYFLDNLQVFTEPIPRIWWSEKPVGEPLRRIRLFDYGFPIGMTRSLPGEGWYALGWIGVVMWCALWGGLLGKAYRNFVSRPQTTWRVACYMILVSTLIVGFRDGSLLTMARTIGVYFTPIAVWFVIARLKGLPSAADIAGAARRAASAVRGVAAANASDVRDAAGAPGADTRPARRADLLAGLPPAVRRRRLALARAGAADSGG
ncbi:oligosaccharide repeat unit polymerase [Novosphingobium bradum]|uniref:Oligosaccharide repeat unit polymerase n=1 Tax=Novosphingobium bradum TaxID=1737444 RepID=A0ABV7IRA5_9SPHN